MIIRSAFVDDAEAVESIYAFHVLNGTASFDTEPPDSEFWRERIAHAQGKKWPFLVAREGGNVLGYAYASQFRNRPAYEHTCENSIYIANDARGKGLGTRLLGKLIEEDEDDVRLYPLCESCRQKMVMLGRAKAHRVTDYEVV